MSKNFRLSGAINARPLRFTAEELINNAEELLRKSSSAPARDAMTPGVLEFYIERGLVDPPQSDGDGEYFTRRHLLQLMAVQVLRGLDLGLDEIGARSTTRT